MIKTTTNPRQMYVWMLIDPIYLFIYFHTDFRGGDIHLHTMPVTGGARRKGSKKGSKKGGKRKPSKKGKKRKSKKKGSKKKKRR
jgi:hypothetical protein